MTTAQRLFVMRGLVAVNLLALAMTILSGGWLGRWIGIFVMSMAAAQWLLLPIWMVLGSGSIRVRVAGSVLGCVLGAVCMSAARLLAYDIPLQVTTVLGMALFQVKIGFLRALFVAAALIVMWLEGLCLVCFLGPIEPSGSTRPQFSLKQLLFVVAVVGIVLGTGSLTRAFPATFRAGDRLFPDVFEALGAALLTCVIVRATLSPAPPAARVSLAILLAVLLGVAESYCLHTSLEYSVGSTLGGVLVAIWTAGSLLVVRACGYRAMLPADWAWLETQADQVEPNPNSESH